VPFDIFRKRNGLGDSRLHGPSAEQKHKPV
jgi:hypothetical protein